MKSEKGFMYLLIAAEGIILVLVILFGIVRQVAEPEKPETTETGREENRIEEFLENTETEDLMPETEQVLAESFSEEIEAALTAMTVEEKVAQLFLVSPETLTGTERVTIAGNGTRNALEAYPVGGILYSEQNYRGQTQMRNLISGARNMSKELNGRYLFAGIYAETGEETVVLNVADGQEAIVDEIFRAEDVSAVSGIEDMAHILWVEAFDELSFAHTPEILCCYHVTDGGISAVTAVNSGADMLCTTDGFEAVYKIVLEAAENGEISDVVLWNAVGHILTQKQVLSQ